jgi:glycine dehydrogenase subunit 2
MLIEPTETESKEELDRFILVMKKLAQEARQEGAEEAFHNYPQSAPVSRVDELKAAREPKLRWVKDAA